MTSSGSSPPKLSPRVCRSTSPPNSSVTKASTPPRATTQQEYRDVTDDEWDEFLAHFEKRKVELGICGRAYATPCQHEHACLRCPLLRPDPAQLERLTEIRTNLLARLAEAHERGWAGEIDGLEVSLAGTEHKLEQMRRTATAATQPVVQLADPTVRASRLAHSLDLTAS